MLARTIAGEHILFRRDADNKITATSNICPHRFAALSEGKIVNGTVACPYHGLEFDTKGRCTHNPHDDKIPKNAVLKTYAVEERDEVIWVWTGDKKADLDAIPDMSAYISTDHLQYVKSYFKADYRYDILVDNLLDLSHANYLHEGSFSSGIPKEASTEVSLDETTVTVTRTELGAPTPPFMIPFMEGIDNVDQKTVIEWHPSQLIRFKAGAAPEGVEISDLNIEFYHCATPADENTTHYFLGVARPGAPNDEQDAEYRKYQLDVIQKEDGPMLESIHAYMDHRELMDMKPVLLNVDSGAMQARAVMKRLMSTES
jgi:vanillate O-demethylase monooxygenase subunit